jgi:hypothetical protein
VNVKDAPLSAVLANRRGSLLEKWLERMLESHPGPATGFLSREEDPFRNPIGHTLKNGLAALFDGLVRGSESSSLASDVECIVKIRAVQDLTPDEAVSFPFMLKQILRADFSEDAVRHSRDFADLEDRIDALALLAFSLYMKCREQIFEIRANEARRSVFALEKARQR